jgi:hypothetical protein
MKCLKALIIAVLAGCFIAAAGYAEPACAGEGSSISVKLTDPNKPCHLECGLLNGGITVTGSSVKEVIVEAKKRGSDKWVDWEGDDDEDRERNKQGLRKIPVYSSSFEVEEDDNHVAVNAESWSSAVDIHITVPTRTSLTLSCINGGDIEVSNVTGEIEAKNINGSIFLNGISGSVVAYVQNGEMHAELKSVTAGKPMSFASFNGDVDVTLPPDVKMTAKVSTHTGDAYSDFDITAVKRPTEVIEDNEEGGEGKYRVRIEEAFYGNVNGGGPDFTFSTFNGDIFIRKGK